MGEGGGREKWEREVGGRSGRGRRGRGRWEREVGGRSGRGRRGRGRWEREVRDGGERGRGRWEGEVGEGGEGGGRGRWEREVGEGEGGGRGRWEREVGGGGGRGRRGRGRWEREREVREGGGRGRWEREERKARGALYCTSPVPPPFLLRYPDIDTFAQDARLVFSNCAFYNEDDSEVCCHGDNECQEIIVKNTFLCQQRYDLQLCM